MGLFCALLMWVSSLHGFLHHHHADDFDHHPECMVCKLACLQADIHCPRVVSPVPPQGVTETRNPMDNPVVMPRKWLLLRAPSTSPPA